MSCFILPMIACLPLSVSSPKRGDGMFGKAADERDNVFSATAHFLFSRASRSTLAWTVSYMISIAWQHSLHRWIVFGSRGDYWKSLIWTYASYTVSLIVSTLMNDVLTQTIKFPHQLAWVLTLGATGVLNYFAVRSSFGNPETPASAKSDVSSKSD